MRNLVKGIYLHLFILLFRKMKFETKKIIFFFNFSFFFCKEVNFDLEIKITSKFRKINFETLKKYFF
jgi:hypothetical protein